MPSKLTDADLQTITTWDASWRANEVMMARELLLARAVVEAARLNVERFERDGGNNVGGEETALAAYDGATGGETE